MEKEFLKVRKKFYCTFSEKHSAGYHSYSSQIHTDGYVTIMAYDNRDASKIAYDSFGTFWNMIHLEKPSNTLCPA
jgi:hypothetical protein